MRERLTVAFVAVTLLLLLVAGAVRSYALSNELHDRERTYLAAEADTVAVALADELRGGRAITRGVLRPLAAPGLKLTYAPRSGRTVTVTDDGFDDADGTVTSSVAVGDGELMVAREHDQALDPLSTPYWAPLLALLALMALVAGLVGYVVARALSEPFRKLAQAAAALGRGRFDLDLPRTRVPEARAIAQALESSAAQLKERLTREREFGLHASHVLRTPLTSLTLHLEELVGDPTLSEDARGSARDCLRAVGQLNRAAGEIVDLSGRGVLVAGAALPLREVATAVAQRWADQLDPAGRSLSAAVDGDLELLFTPGPVEQVLDVVLREVVLPDRGDVRLVLEGGANRLLVDVTCTDRSGSHAPRTRVGPQVEATLAALGGRVEVSTGDAVLRIHLPRR